ncbi:MAG: hypothetical protein J5I93_01870 [Pirellulaceae bacterium]|nr:hypothetical protein [Pirellulaceae bacterium]
MMSGLLLAAWLVVTPQGGSLSETGVEPRRYHEINHDLRELIRAHARAESPAAQAAVVQEMCVLYVELKRDPRLASSDTLQEYKAKLWSRLVRIQTDLEQQLARQQRQSGRPADVSAPAAGPNDTADLEASGSLAGSLSLLGGVLGGPADLLAHGGSLGGGSPGGGSLGGGAAGGDYGQSLVELIQRTIAPEFWDVNGGPGTIVYFAPLRVLVVRATSEIHHKIGGGVQGLRRAGQ